MPVTTIGLDADDTLWESEVHFVDVENRFRELIAGYDPSDDIQTHLYAVERRNLDYFGYGVKSFTLSMIETAIQLTDGSVSGDDVHRIVEWGKEMIKHPVDLLAGVRETLELLSRDYKLLIITKGDLLHQEEKVAQSGLADLVDGVEVLTEKDPAAYQGVFEKHQLVLDQFIMVGNSIKSDILPVVELGAHAVHIPSTVTWAFEADHDGDAQRDGFHVLESIRDLPELAARIG